MNFLFLLFTMACRVWHESKINYVFVFEYDTRHHLDWRQLAEVSTISIAAIALLIVAASLFLPLSLGVVHVAHLLPFRQ